MFSSEGKFQMTVFSGCHGPFLGNGGLSTRGFKEELVQGIRMPWSYKAIAHTSACPVAFSKGTRKDSSG